MFKRTENRDFIGSSFTLTFNVRGTGEEDDRNDNSASTTVNISRVADLQVSRYIVCVVSEHRCNVVRAVT